MTYKTRFQYLLDKARDIAGAQVALKPRSAPLPPLFFVTDPKRTPHPEDIAVHLPDGCGLIYRHFGEGHALQRARLLRKITSDHGLTLMIGEDFNLAAEVQADGIHLRQQSLGKAAELKLRFPELRLSAACHDLATLKTLTESEDLHAIFISPVFSSQSPSAEHVKPLGIKGVLQFTEISTLPVYGLGGIGCDNIDSLRHTGLSGIGAVDAFRLMD